MNEFDISVLESENETIASLRVALIAVGFPEEEAQIQTNDLTTLIGIKTDVFIEALRDPANQLGIASQPEEEVALEDLKNIVNSTIQEYVRSVLDGLSDQEIATFKKSFYGD